MSYPFNEWRIIGCWKCHMLQIVRSDRKTRKCPRCGYVMQLDFRRIRTWFKSDDLKTVEYALQKLKMKHKVGKYQISSGKYKPKLFKQIYLDLRNKLKP